MKDTLPAIFFGPVVHLRDRVPSGGDAVTFPVEGVDGGSISMLAVRVG